jgi:hypothetical protein
MATFASTGEGGVERESEGNNPIIWGLPSSRMTDAMREGRPTYDDDGRAEDESVGIGCAYVHMFHVRLGTRGSGARWRPPTALRWAI